MRIMHVALGGCLSGGEVRYGLTEDTGGHIAYVLGATEAQARRAGVEDVSIVTRAFRDPRLGAEFAEALTPLGPRRRIIRLNSRRPDYLEKADLVAELPSLTEAFLAHLSRGPRPDLIHAHFADAAVLAQAAQAAFGIPWVLHSHSLGRDKAGADAERIARETAAIRGADAIIASSRDEAERQLGAYDAEAEGRTHRIGPGVRLGPEVGPDRARALIAPWLTDPAKPVILAIARPVAKKNLRRLVEAFGGSTDLRARANLVILAGLREGLTGGAGETDRVTLSLFDAVDRLDLWGQVALPARHEAADVRSLYALAAISGGIFVNPALHEPFGLTVVEAIQAGVPVAATSGGGPAEIIEVAGFGRIFDPTDRAATAGAIAGLLDDPLRKRRAARAAQRCRAHFAWDAWAQEVEGVAARLCRAAPAPRPGPRRILVSDMDGTLTGDRAAADALAEHLARTPETELVVATGRPLTEARRVLRDWGLPEPRVLIASVGSEIWLRGEGGRFRLDRDYAQAISTGWDGNAVGRVVADCGLVPQARYEQRAWKVSCLGAEADARRLSDALEAEGVAARVIASHGRFIDVLPMHAGKAAAASHVARLFALDPALCLAAGDSGNDRDLLLWAGHAVLPANALAELDDLTGPGLLRSRRAHAGAILDLIAEGVRPVPALLAAE